jgi:hypothetical protein
MPDLATSSFNWSVLLTGTCQVSEYGYSLQIVQVRVGPVTVQLLSTSMGWIAIAQAAGNLYVANLGPVVSGVRKSAAFTISTAGVVLQRGRGADPDLGAGLGEGIVTPLMAQECRTTDAWALAGAAATVTVAGHTWTFDLSSVLSMPVPFLDVQTMFSPSAVLSTHTAATVQVSPTGGGKVSWQGISGPCGTWAYQYFDPPGGIENWDWTGDGETLTLTLSEWAGDATHAAGPGFDGSTDYTMGQCPIGGGPLGGSFNTQSMTSRFSTAAYILDLSGLRVLVQKSGVYAGSTQPADFTQGALVHGGFTKIAAMGLDWPNKEDTEDGGTGAFAENDPIPVKLSDLLGVTDLQTSVITVYGGVSDSDGWVRGSNVNLPTFWSGPPLTFHVDQKWLRDHNLLAIENVSGPDTEAPQIVADTVMVIDGTMWDQGDGAQDPWHRLPPTVAPAVSVDLSGSHSVRLSGWSGCTGGGVGSSGDVTVPALIDADSVIGRTLLSNFHAKYEWIINPFVNAWTWLPQFYYLLGQDAPTCTDAVPPYGPADGWPAEDVCAWNYAWMRAVVIAPSTVLLADVLQLQCQYEWIAALVDNHYTGSRRVAGEDDLGLTPFKIIFGGPATATWQVTGMVPGLNTLYFCLMLPAEGVCPKLDLVSSAELKFPRQTEAGNWTFRDLSLVGDPYLI